MVAKPKPSCSMFSSFSPKLEIESSPSPKIHKTRLLCFLTASSLHSCLKHSYYAAHSTALLPRTSPRTTPAPFPYICKPASKLTKPKTPPKKKKQKKNSNNNNNNKLESPSALQSLPSTHGSNTFFSPDSLYFFPSLPPLLSLSLSLSLSLFLHEKVRKNNRLSLHIATSIGASFVVVDSSAPTRPSVRPNTYSRLSVGDGSEGRRKQQRRHGRTVKECRSWSATADGQTTSFKMLAP